MSLPTTIELAEYTLAQQHPITIDWSPLNNRLTALDKEHQVDLDLARDHDLAAARRDRFAPELSAELYLNTWTEIRPGLQVMLSIRYEGGDPDCPFVDVSVSSLPLTDSGDIAAVTDRATGRFGVLGPRYLRWWTSEPAGHIPGTGQDKRFLAAPITDLAHGTVPDQLTLRPSTDLSHYDQAVAAYQSVDRTHPDHHRQAALEPVEDLGELQHDGTLFDVLLDGNWVGYVAADPGHKLGLAGYKVAELVLTEGARGHGYGCYLTTLLCRALADRASTGSVLIGTIHHHNTGAVRAAQQAGRHDIGGWVTLPLK